MRPPGRVTDRLRRPGPVALVCFLALSLVAAGVVDPGSGGPPTQADRQPTVTADARADSGAGPSESTDRDRPSLGRELSSIARSTPVRPSERSQAYGRLASVAARDRVAGAHLVNVSAGSVLASAGVDVTEPSGNRLRPGPASLLDRATAPPSACDTPPFPGTDRPGAALVVATAPGGDRVAMAVLDAGPDWERARPSCVTGNGTARPADPGERTDRGGGDR